MKTRLFWAIGAAGVASFGCGNSGGTGGTGGASAHTSTTGTASTTSTMSTTSTHSGTTTTGTQSTTGSNTTTTSSTGMGGSGPLPAGWLYTSGNEIHVSDGSGTGPRWMGRGVNTDDLYLCGYNYHLDDPNGLSILQQEMDGLASAWKPTFVRVSLGMNSYPVVSDWLSTNAYKTGMTSIIKSLGSHAGTYVLVSLRSDTTMAAGDPGDPEPTFVPAAATDPVYEAIVDSFANDNFVVFGLSNEPGGNAGSEDEIRTAMDHAVSVIRAHEDAIGAHHHIVSVQGAHYTSTAAMWSSNPLPYDNVVYEVHGYPPDAGSYTFGNIPVIIGEYGYYGDPSAATALQADFESKQIPNLAWDFEAYSNCTPDLLTVNHDAGNLVPSAWGTLVKKYLNDHAP